MSKVTYVQPDGARETFDIAAGKSLMLGAQSHGVAGILGECGGQGMCATCHVYVDPKDLALLPPIGGHEGATLGECGGQAMGATCHVYVDPKDLDLLPPMADEEDAMLEDTASERRPTSRLSCQLEARDDLDGLVGFLPEAQAL